MQLNWDAISAISDIAAAVAVVVSLWYVGAQVHQNTKAIVSGSRMGLLDSDLGLISEYMTHAVDPHLIGDDVKLSPEDERRFFWLIIKAIRIREWAWNQHRLGLLDEFSWQSYMAPVAGIFSTLRARTVLDMYTGDPVFVQLIRDRLTAAQA